ncbi:hypothetical protein PRIPAC_73548 [Pristionchus pacificus]|uniref:Uncharacterized protein n=1 Tax=Pristionchus pacificus TaxID=54126 RepID=A0A2A6BGF0_PRIPA|nr:hypothetical protein PRIPAC_73548 [Pristionchus pacificus]|eukprot:PDM64936.1 hypothetical protein PRIPAC_53192 [Pristionchus pacificus]
MVSPPPSQLPYINLSSLRKGDKACRLPIPGKLGRIRILRLRRVRPRYEGAAWAHLFALLLLSILFMLVAMNMAAAHPPHAQVFVGYRSVAVCLEWYHVYATIIAVSVLILPFSMMGAIGLYTGMQYFMLFTSLFYCISFLVLTFPILVLLIQSLVGVCYPEIAGPYPIVTLAGLCLFSCYLFHGFHTMTIVRHDMIVLQGTFCGAAGPEQEVPPPP